MGPKFGPTSRRFITKCFEDHNSPLNKVMQSYEEITMFCDQHKDSPKDQELFHQDQDPHRLSAKVLQQDPPVLNICHLISLLAPIQLRLPLYHIHSG
jgi:hypothetical protein